MEAVLGRSLVGDELSDQPNCKKALVTAAAVAETNVIHSPISQHSASPVTAEDGAISAFVIAKAILRVPHRLYEDTRVLSWFETQKTTQKQEPGQAEESAELALPTKRCTTFHTLFEAPRHDRRERALSSG